MKCYIYTRSTCTHNLSTYTHNLSTYTHYQSFVSKPGMKCKLSTLESSLNRVLVISLSYSFSCSFSFSFFLILLLFRSCVLFPIWRLATCTVECAHTTLRELYKINGKESSFSCSFSFPFSFSFSGPFFSKSSRTLSLFRSLFRSLPHSLALSFSRFLPHFSYSTHCMQMQ